MKGKGILLALLVLLLPAGHAGAVVDRKEALARSRAVLGSELPDLVFRDSRGRTVRLADWRGKPLLITLVYTACSDVCPTLIRNLRPIIENAQEMLGEDRFRVATIGFDAERDTPERMRAFARRQGVDLPNWYFLSADPETIDRLVQAVGFTLYPYAGGYGHLAQLTLVDPEGRIYRQIYGGVFEPPQVIEPLKDAVFGRDRPGGGIAGIWDRVRLFCTVYDPNSGRYSFDYSLFIGIAIGLASLTGVATLLVREWRKSVRERSKRTKPTMFTG